MQPTNTAHVTGEEAIQMHASGRPGKVEIRITKPLTTQRDLSLAYSPGVAEPCLRIHKDPALAYDYTAKGNLVAVISNGTAVLGLGNLGALASKPVMEGKAVLFKRFADIDGIDIEVDTPDIEEFINAVRYLGPTFGGINLEDIKAPECFVIEQRLRELMDIPVFHDDQHGTAIIATAGLINALDLTGRTLANSRLVVNGAGASAIACVELIKRLGMPHENVTMCDTQGVIYQGREKGMNQWKSAHAVKTKARTLADAIAGADLFLGLSAKGVVSQEMVKSMAAKPVIFAMANPDPEITPEEAREARADAIVATGRSDYPNQINNVLGFPYIFRGALDVRASTINDEMKIAAAHALAQLAREDVPDEVDAAYAGRRLRYGPDYIIPVPFDPRLIISIPPAVAKSAIDTGVARRPMADIEGYKVRLRARLDPTAWHFHAVHSVVRANPKRVVFAEGEEEKVIRAALAFRNSQFGTPILIGREDRIRQTMAAIGLTSGIEGIEIHNARLSTANRQYMDFLYARLQRQGYLFRDCQRMVHLDRNTFGACMVACGDADAMVTGLTRNYSVAYEEVTRVIDPKPGRIVFGLTILFARGRTVFVADTAVTALPTPEQTADIAIQTAAAARQMGHEPRVAVVSYSTFGNPVRRSTQTMREAVQELDRRKVDFEYDGEMAADVALEPELLALYPFCRLSGPANVLIMPGLHSAHISTKLMGTLGGGTVVGPLLIGLSMPVQILRMNATVSDLVNLGTFAAYEAITST
ncbi:MAG: NADP-dependent malic enzyme [Proteobacteria bacterium]|nr:NADP-dependent malic enzyme [Pseudomonadota bacterium]